MEETGGKGQKQHHFHYSISFKIDLQALLQNARKPASLCSHKFLSCTLRFPQMCRTAPQNFASDGIISAKAPHIPLAKIGQAQEKISGCVKF